ncbi:MAG: hypothetical protein WD810_07630 [Solirubrobacterales bacterium]
MRGVSGGFRGRALLLAGIAALALVAVFGTSVGAEERRPGAGSEQILLRLHDLPPGYFSLDLWGEGAGYEMECDRLQPADPVPKLARFIKRFSPAGCIGAYVRLYRVPGGTPAPPLVGTGALYARSVEAAETALALAPQLLGHLTEDVVPQEVAAPETVGDATRLFHWDNVPPFLFENGRFGSFLVWRSGSVLGAVFAAGGSPAANDRAAAELARRQQAHIEDPTPYTAAERYDLEVALDDPALKAPVYWLGRTFGPGHGLPQSRFESGSAVGGLASGLPGQKVRLAYTRGLVLNSWTREGWKRFLATPISRKLRTWRCTESTELTLAHGDATAFAAYDRDYDVCPHRLPTRYFAIARIGGMVTAVNFVSCRRCSQPGGGAYNSLAGMKAVVRGLKLRPKPAY